MSRKANWKKAFASLLLPIVLFCSVRWLLFEPFMIPSGSMIPTLLVHDFIWVNKLAYGLRIPFSNQYAVWWHKPERGDVIVFRYPEDPKIYFVKRLVGLPGDRIAVENGQLFVNGLAQEQKSMSVDKAEEGFSYFSENGHLVRYFLKANSQFSEITVPAGMYFAMGDNRDQSSDSRFWGAIPEFYLVGRAGRVLFSCERTLPSAPSVCDPSAMRWERFFLSIH